MTSNAMGTPMPPFFREGERVIIEFGVGDPQPGEIIAISHHCATMTVRLGKGIMGEGDMPLQWSSANEYDLLAGGKVKVRKLV